MRQILPGKQAAWAALAAGGLLLVGCGGETEQASVDPDSLQGEPIRPAAAVPESGPPAAPEPAEPAAEPVAEAPPAVPPLLALEPAEPEGEADETAEPSVVKAEEGEFIRVGFDRLSGYEIEIDDALLNPPTNAVEGEVRSAAEQIPPEVLDLDGQPVALRGFMLPLKVEGGLVTELLIMKDQSMCCFGVTPQIHEWVSVTMEEEGVKPLMDQAVTLYGKLSVGEMRENGYLVGIYSMDGVGMLDPLDE